MNDSGRHSRIQTGFRAHLQGSTPLLLRCSQQVAAGQVIYRHTEPPGSVRWLTGPPVSTLKSECFNDYGMLLQLYTDLPDPVDSAACI